VENCTLSRQAQEYRRIYGALALSLPEFLAVRAGLKTATQLTLGARAVVEDERERVERLSREAGLRCTFYTRRGLEKVIIARRALPPPANDEDENRDNRFSYPVCCVASFMKRPQEYYFVRYLRARLRNGARYSFVMNPFTVATPFHLVCHLPCSMFCRRTLESAHELLAVLRQRTPEVAAEAERWNRRPALYTDICGIGVLFEGTLDRGRLTYRSFDYIGEPAELLDKSGHNVPADVALFAALLAALSEGDEVELEAARLVVRSRGREVRRLARPRHLKWRLVDFV
jgi:hypothetical protein